MRFHWKIDKMIEVVEKLKGRSSDYNRAKRNNKVESFYEEVCREVEIEPDGKKVKDLLKNLGKEYRAVKQKETISGAATESPELRDSHQLFLIFEEYYSVYFPKGGAVMPTVLLSEAGPSYSATLPSTITPSPQRQTLKRGKLISIFRLLLFVIYNYCIHF